MKTENAEGCKGSGKPGAFAVAAHPVTSVPVFSEHLKTGIITPVQRTILLAVILLVTCIFCAAPHFHPEAVLGWRYHWALDALFHGSYYFALTFLLYPFGSRRMGAGCFYGAVLFLSFLLEGAQLWIPGRSWSWLDLAANAAGISGAVILQCLRYKSNRLINI